MFASNINKKFHKTDRRNGCKIFCWEHPIPWKGHTQLLILRMHEAA